MDGKSRSYMRAVCAVLAAGLLTAGCGKEETAAAETAEIAVPEAAKRAEGSETIASAEFFSEFKNTVFIFSSGAGAWRTELQIREDGSLSRRFEDANMGEIGEENPQGTIYESVFTGRLGSPVRLDENSYQVDILEMEYENPLETEEIMLL